MCGARVEECCQQNVVDVDEDLHGLLKARLDSRERMDGDHRVIGLFRLRWVILVDNLNVEELFVDLPVPLCKEIIAMKAFVVVTVFSHLGR
jgi:hypothetical protein